MSNAIEMAPIINANVAAVAAALAAAGALSVTVSYLGSGDNSDGTDSIEIEWPEGANPEELKVSGSKLDWIRDADGKFNKTPVVVERPLERFLSDVLTDQIIEASGQDGFENGDGGRGEITVFADGRCTHEHWDYVVTTEYVGEFRYGVGADEDKEDEQDEETR
jgi:hypothetical protein